MEFTDVDRLRILNCIAVKVGGMPDDDPELEVYRELFNKVSVWNVMQTPGNKFMERDK